MSNNASCYPIAAPIPTLTPSPTKESQPMPLSMLPMNPQMAGLFPLSPNHLVPSFSPNSNTSSGSLPSIPSLAMSNMGPFTRMVLVPDFTPQFPGRKPQQPFIPWQGVPPEMLKGFAPQPQVPPFVFNLAPPSHLSSPPTTPPKNFDNSVGSVPSQPPFCAVVPPSLHTQTALNQTVIPSPVTPQTRKSTAANKRKRSTPESSSSTNASTSDTSEEPSADDDEDDRETKRRMRNAIYARDVTRRKIERRQALQDKMDQDMAEKEILSDQAQTLVELLMAAGVDVHAGWNVTGLEG